MKYDYLIVGAGLFGIIIAAELLKKGKTVFIVDRRDSIGGNCLDKFDEESGLYVHIYGPHIIHLTSLDVFHYLAQYDELVPYHHQVKTYYNGKYYDFPINLNTINKYYDKEFTPQEAELFLKQKVNNCQNVQNLEQKIISLVGEDFYNAFFKEYTIKQWGEHPVSLSADIISRIPIRFTYNTSYYSKKYSFIPNHSYSQLLSRILYKFSDGKNLLVKTSTSLNNSDILSNKFAFNTIYTGSIDELFEYCYGKLSYRSLKFKHEKINSVYANGSAVINYPELKYPYTRITEHKYFNVYRDDFHDNNVTIITKEFSSDRAEEPFYPCLNTIDVELYNKYRLLTDSSNIIVGGRLGLYQYLDMEQTVLKALNLVKEIG